MPSERTWQLVTELAWTLHRQHRGTPAADLVAALLILAAQIDAARGGDKAAFLRLADELR